MRKSSVGCCSWLREPETLVWVFSLIIALLPIWLFSYVPSQDGPTHLENARIILNYQDSESSIFREYYIINKSPENWAGHFILAGLTTLFPPLIAEKILISIYVILFPLSVLSVLNSMQIQDKFLALPTILFAYNFLFHMGFYSFPLNLPAFFSSWDSG